MSTSLLCDFDAWQFTLTEAARVSDKVSDNPEKKLRNLLFRADKKDLNEEEKNLVGIGRKEERFGGRLLFSGYDILKLRAIVVFTPIVGFTAALFIAGKFVEVLRDKYLKRTSRYSNEPTLIQVPLDRLTGKAGAARILPQGLLEDHPAFPVLTIPIDSVIVEIDQELNDILKGAHRE